jgi:hypothetical protein
MESGRHIPIRESLPEPAHPQILLDVGRRLRQPLLEASVVLGRRRIGLYEKLGRPLANLFNV